MRPVQKRCCAFWILLFQSVQAFSADAPSQISPSLPSEYAEFLKMDQNYNVPGRELMSDEQKAVVPVYHFDKNLSLSFFE
jgi:hypothetical protein